MRIFISHNKADLITARAIALLLVEQGLDVWFDEWEIRPGDSDRPPSARPGSMLVH